MQQSVLFMMLQLSESIKFNEKEESRGAGLEPGIMRADAAQLPPLLMQLTVTCKPSPGLSSLPVTSFNASPPPPASVRIPI